MADFHLHVQQISRAVGRSATAAAAYRSGEKIEDSRTGETHDYTRKGGVVHSEMVLPGGGTANRGEYWNRLEAHHKRKDANLSVEMDIALPFELTAAQRQQLASEFAAELSNKYKVAADLNIHKPSRGRKEQGEETEEPDATDRKQNHHCHIMLSACYTEPDGTLGKKCVELDPIHCSRQKPPIENMADWSRRRWAELANLALEKAGHDERIDHRTLEAQGIDRTPTVHLGQYELTEEAKLVGISSRHDKNKVIREVNQITAELAAVDGEIHQIENKVGQIDKQIIELQASRRIIIEEIAAKLEVKIKLPPPVIIPQVQPIPVINPSPVSPIKPVVAEPQSDSVTPLTQTKTNLPTQQPAFDFPLLAGAEFAAFVQFVQRMKDIAVENLVKLCQIASDMSKYTVQNEKGTLSNEKYNDLTDSQEKQVLAIAPKAEFTYATGQPAILINGQPVPEIAKSQFVQPQQQKSTQEQVLKTGGRK